MKILFSVVSLPLRKFWRVTFCYVSLGLENLHRLLRQRTVDAKRNQTLSSL